MMKHVTASISIAVATLSVALSLAGCGSSEPQHEVKPFAERPTPTSDFTKLKTPEEKIKFIQDSKAPDTEKERAIAQVRAGAL